MLKFSRSQAFIFLMMLAMFTSPVAADWNVDVLGAPENQYTSPGDYIFMSDNSRQLIFARLTTDRGEPINSSVLTDSSEFQYRYNISDGDIKPLKHYYKGLWYANITADKAKHGYPDEKAQIIFEAHGDRFTDDGINSGGWQNDTETFVIGNYTVEPIEVKESFLPGEKFFTSVNVSRINGGNTEDAKVFVRFTNGSWTSDNYRLSYNASKKLYTGKVAGPNKPSEKYVMRIVASNSSKTFSNPFGSYSKMVKTNPELEGELTKFSALQGCEEARDVQKCEPETEIDVEFNVTSGSASQVNLTAYKVNRSNDRKINYTQIEMEKDEGLYTGSFTVPNLNTSKYKPRIFVEVNASNKNQHFSLERNITYNSLEVKNIGDYTAEQGLNYTAKFFAATPYTLDRYNKSRFEALTLNITDGNNNHFKEFNLSELNFSESDNVFRREVSIPPGSALGGWEFVVNATDLYGNYDVIEWTVSVKGTENDFNVSDISLWKDEKGVQEFSVYFENFRNQKLQVNTSFEGSGGNISEIGVNGSFNLSADEVSEVPVTVNASDFVNFSREVEFSVEETGFEKTVNLSVMSPECVAVNGSLCLLGPEELTVNMAPGRSSLRNVSLLYTAGEGSETQVEAIPQGNITEYISTESGYRIEDKLKASINFSASEEVSAGGSIIFTTLDNEEVTVPVQLFVDSNLKELMVSPETIELGTVTPGSSEEARLTIENTGERKIRNISFTSEDFALDPNASRFNISSGGSRDTVINLQNLQNPGTLTVQGLAGNQSLSTEVEVSVEVTKDYGERAEELQRRIDDLRPVENESLSERLNQTQDTLEELRNAWEEGNYGEAQNLYSEVRSSLSTLEPKIRAQRNPENPEDPETSNTTDNTDGNGNSSMLPIIVIALFVILLIAGFVFYESYIPEEGDPLYGVLGEE